VQTQALWDRYRGEGWRPKVFQHVRTDLEHIWDLSRASDKERKRMERTKEELTKMQADLDQGRWDNGLLNDVIDSLRKKGVHDKLHSHPVASIVYHLTDCTSMLYGPDGKASPSPTNGKAGTAFAVPVIPAHSAENIGPEDCHQIFVERK